MQKNIIIEQGFNEEIRWNKIDEACVREAATRIIEFSKKALDNIKNVKAHTFKNTLLAYDDLNAEAGRVAHTIGFLSYNSPDPELQKVCNEAVREIQAFSSRIMLDQDLYNAFKAFSETEEAKALTGEYRKYADELLKEFERNGMQLPEEQRKELQDIRDRLTKLIQDFGINIRKHDKKLSFTEQELRGLPDNYKKQHKNPEGDNYIIGTDYPSFLPFMRLAESAEARKRLFLTHAQIAKDENPQILTEVLRLRKKKAEMLGYATHAAYKLENKMAKTPENVWQFENELSEKVKPLAQKEYDELLSVKKGKENSEADTVYSWESSFFNTILKKTKYELDPEKVREYFELGNVVNGIFKVCKRLFDIDLEETASENLWHEDVRLYELRSSEGKTLGRLYFDPYPRDHKYKHAACFGMISGKETPEGYRVPTAALVCNFPKPFDDRPSLLQHSDVITLFHEFGHGLHNLLTKAKLSAFSGTSVSRDYVEVQSQVFENWAWSYESLRDFAFHYKTGEVLPESLHNRMTEARKFGQAIHTLQQIFYGTYEFTLHDKFDAEGSESVTKLMHRLQDEISLFPSHPESAREASFGHLMGYDAGYYGYLWSEVFACDIFSVFEEKGIFDATLGDSLRENIFAPGGSRNEMQQLKDFLGREPRNEAFLKNIGF